MPSDFELELLVAPTSKMRPECLGPLRPTDGTVSRMRHRVTAAFISKSRAGEVALQRFRLSASAPTRMHFRANAFYGARVSKNHICYAASHQRPPCESDLCYFSADRHFPLFTQLRRLARANGPKSRRMRTATASLGLSSAAKSRTLGMNSTPQWPKGRRLFLRGWQREIRTIG